MTIKTNICNCEICKNAMNRVGYKKYRKWNARYVSKIKKELKKLKDKGIKYGQFCSENKYENTFACLEDTLAHAMCIYHECKLIKKNNRR